MRIIIINATGYNIQWLWQYNDNNNDAHILISKFIIKNINPKK